MPRKLIGTLVTVGAATTGLMLIPDPSSARAGAIAALCLGLWLLEVVPPFVPTLLMLALAPIALGGDGATAGLMRWMADPVLALFFGGLALGCAARRHGLDVVVAGAVVHGSRGSAARLLLLAMLATAGLSMWISNIAAAAMMLAALVPVTAAMPEDGRAKRALLIGVAIAANLGGMATPIGSGPNGIAIGFAAEIQRVTFAHWLAFAAPLVAATMALAFMLIKGAYGLAGVEVPTVASPRRLTPSGWWVVAIAAVTAVAWMSEPFHGVGAATIALCLATTLFASGLLGRKDLGAIDWSTLVLVAGGLGVGRLLDHAGLLTWFSTSVSGATIGPLAALACLLAAAALFSAVMSNTATASLLIPLALVIDPNPPQWGMLVALAASFGMPFAVSTPPNAMVIGHGAKAWDLLWIGSLLMVGGVTVLVLTGPSVLGFLGIGSR